MNDYKSAFNAMATDISAIIALLGFDKYPGVDPVLRAITDLVLAKAEAQALREQNTKSQHMLADVVAKHFAENIKRSTAQKSMDVYLSEGIRLLEEEVADARRNAEQHEVRANQYSEELAALRARVVVVQDWHPLTAVGQVETGDLLRFTVGGKEIEAPARLVIAPGDPKEEIVYNRGKNHYFITSMAVDGTSSHKSVMVKRLNGKAVSEGLLRRVITPALTSSDAQDRIDAQEELRDLLDQVNMVQGKVDAMDGERG